MAPWTARCLSSLRLSVLLRRFSLRGFGVELGHFQLLSVASSEVLFRELLEILRFLLNQLLLSLLLRSKALEAVQDYVQDIVGRLQIQGVLDQLLDVLGLLGWLVHLILVQHVLVR